MLLVTLLIVTAVPASAVVTALDILTVVTSLMFSLFLSACVVGGVQL